MDTPESITAQLWKEERSAFNNIIDDEFASQTELLHDVKKEVRAIGSFQDIEGARAYYKAINDIVMGEIVDAWNQVH